MASRKSLLSLAHSERPTFVSPISKEEYLTLRDDAREALNAGAQDEAARMLHLCGYSWGQLARLTGYPSWQDARRAVTSLYRAERLMQRDLRQQAEIARLERLERHLQPQIEAGNIEAIKEARELSAERRRIMADNEPVRQAPVSLPPLEEMERAAGTLASSLGHDPRAAAAKFRALAVQHGYLPAAPQTESQDEPEDTELCEEVEVAETVVLEESEEHP